LAPRDPQLAFWVLLPSFMFDAALNVGIQIGQDGFLLKQSPARNRAMFLASGMALAGLVGCLTSICCGAFLTSLRGWSATVVGFEVNAFHLLFWGSLIARAATLRVVCRIEEPAAADHKLIALTMIRTSMSRVSLRTARRRKLENTSRSAVALGTVDRAA